MKKILASLIALTALLSLVACSTPGNSDSTTAGNGPSGNSSKPVAETTTDPKYQFEFSETSTEYAGKFVILNGFSEATTLFTTCSMLGSGDSSADQLDAAIYRRNIMLSDRYGVEVSEIPCATNKQYSNFEKEVTSGDASFDMAMINNSNVPKLATAGYLYDLATIDNISLEKAWYDQSANEQLRYGKHLYYTYSDMDTTQFDAVRCMYFNQSIMDRFGLSTNELYQTAINGDWTLDKMYEYAKDIYTDDGNGIVDEGDTFPFVGVPSTSLSALISGADASYIKMDPKTSTPYANFTTESFIDTYNKILDVMFKDNFFYTGCSKNTQATDMFVSGHSLFLLTTIVSSNTMRQSMSADFGFLPLPKYNTDQEKYICNAPNPYAICVPYNSQDPERTGFVIEAMSYLSTDTVRTAYFEVRLYGRTSRDALSWQTLDLIYSNIAYSVPVQSSVGFSGTINKMMAANDRSIAAYIKSVQATVENDIANFIDEVSK